MLAPKPALATPYPGLRAFETQEGYLFYGREQQTQELLDRLAHHRFLAVVGSSGTGKSSLVRAGLVPALQRGFLTAATSRWRIAIIRPGNAPFDALAAELGKPEARPVLGASSHGLVQAVRDLGLAEGESLLLVVDQFEELFRFRRESLATDGGSEAALFVAALLQASRVVNPAIYVVLTMRSDFLGDCAEFSGLPEALNDSQYLVPRLTTEQMQSAIERPLRFSGASITPRLVQTLLQDIGGSSEQLPVLQHALNRTFVAWKKAAVAGPIDLEHYADSTVATALDHHAEQIWESLTPTQQAVAERLFRALTTSENGRPVRRPTLLKTLYEVAGAREEAGRAGVREVVRVYSSLENSFLVTPQRGVLEDSTVVDISHESLIRKWGKLKLWVLAESDAVDWYRSAAEDAKDHALQLVRTWRDPELKKAFEFRQTLWNEAWAKRICPAPYTDVMDFLDQGAAEQRAEIDEREADERHERELLQARIDAENRAKKLWGAVAVLSVVALGVVYYFYSLAADQRDRADNLRATVSQQAAALKGASEITKKLEQARDKEGKLRRQLQASPSSQAGELQQRLKALSEERRQLVIERSKKDAEAAQQSAIAQKMTQSVDYTQSAYVQAQKSNEQLQERVKGLENELKTVRRNDPKQAK